MICRSLRLHALVLCPPLPTSYNTLLLTSIASSKLWKSQVLGAPSYQKNHQQQYANNQNVILHFKIETQTMILTCNVQPSIKHVTPHNNDINKRYISYLPLLSNLPHLLGTQPTKSHP